jgi:hypothetical protein
LVAAVAFAVVVVTGSSAANVKGTRWVDKAGGYTITIPKTWQLIPRTTAQVNTLIATLKKQKKTALASFYKSILATTAGRTDLKAYRFQAFAWPDSETQPVPIQVSLGLVKTKTPVTTKALPSVAAVFANQLASNKGAKITVPKIVTLPAGKAEFIEGTIPIGGGIDNGLELYLIPHGKTVYELAFQIEASQLKTATLFTSIAQQFRFL